MRPSIDSRLSAWSQLPLESWRTLIVGNGLSRNLWEGFSYDSLYSQAVLGLEARSIFNELGTSNFEQCLECLQHARIALNALNEPTTSIEEVYEEIRSSLFSTVRAVHLPWKRLPRGTEDLIAGTLDDFRSVFTSNYDLSLYWSHLDTSEPVEIVDFFWSDHGKFDPSNTNVYSKSATKVHYLHGALHLWQDDDLDQSGKWLSAAGNLLKFEEKYSASMRRRPLLVSEGKSLNKYREIRRSPYLSYCLESLREDDQPTVVFGHSFSQQDQHIVEALRRGPSKPICYSIFPEQSDLEIMEEKGRVLSLLKGHEVHFFDSTSHPFGSSKLTVGV